MLDKINRSRVWRKDGLRIKGNIYGIKKKEKTDLEWVDIKFKKVNSQEINEYWVAADRGSNENFDWKVKFMEVFYLSTGSYECNVLVQVLRRARLHRRFRTLSNYVCT